MGFMDDLRSGRFSKWAPWIAYLTCFLCFVIGIAAIFTFNIGWGIVALIVGVVMIFLELPVLACMANPIIAAVVNFFKPHWLRGLLYVGLAAAMWASLAAGGGILIILAVLLTILAILNFMAAFRKEPVELVGGAGPSGGKPPAAV